ncbi:MAG: TIM barrel protein [Candidatus Aenigmarchaeota archaeon]|nr:TIM barrel protein [Candidatus Aenigmarchaeota archaeon]
MRIYLGPAGVPQSAAKTDTVSGIERVSELKLGAMEVEFVRGVRMSNGLADQAGKAARKLGIRLSVHAPYYVNLCNPEVVDASKLRILDSCERGHHMGAGVIVFHPGYYGKLGHPEALGMVKKACIDMSHVLRKKGWNVKLGLEATGKVSQFGTIDEILSVCSEVKGCVPVIDWAHIFAKYQGKVDFKKVLSKVISAGYDRLHTHFSNIEFTDKGEKRHLNIDHRQPDFRKVAKVILGSGLDEITIISESPALENDALVMRKELEGLGHKF